MTIKVILGRLLAASTTVSLLTACGGAVASPAPPGTVQGTVTAGPRCPVERIDRPCPPAPVRDGDVRLLRGDGSAAAETHTDTAGAFQLTAEPGTYTVIATNTGGLRTQASRTVTLTAGRTEHVDLQVDTGIR
jgi:hypothetical protein